MKVEFIHKAKENSRLILIFTGWSAEPRLYANVSHDTWDVAVVYDYSDLTLPDAVLDGYYTVYVFAWSLGVFAAERTLDPRRITAAYAIKRNSPSCKRHSRNSSGDIHGNSRQSYT